MYRYDRMLLIVHSDTVDAMPKHLQNDMKCLDGGNDLYSLSNLLLLESRIYTSGQHKTVPKNI